MNQMCKVCEEPAAGFHFGAFTCEGCKSFFGRSYNNLSSISECKNNNECVINKKNRTACKACRLRKCLMVGMSKGGSRYGRRSNWFKIHCLLQEQQQQAEAKSAAYKKQGGSMPQLSPPGGHMMGSYPPMFYPPMQDERAMMMSQQSLGSPNSYSSNESSEKYPTTAAAAAAPHHKEPYRPVPFAGGMPSFPMLPNSAFLPSSHLMFPGYHPAVYQNYLSLLRPSPERYQPPTATAAAAFSAHSDSRGSTPSEKHSVTPVPSRNGDFTANEDIDITSNSEEDVVVSDGGDERLSSPASASDVSTTEEQDDPIDLSMKSSSSREYDDRFARNAIYKRDSDIESEHEDMKRRKVHYNNSYPTEMNSMGGMRGIFLCA